MATADTSGTYRLLREWQVSDVVIGSVGEIHTFYEWVAILGITPQAMVYHIEYFDGSSPSRPVEFELVPTPPVSIPFISLSDVPNSYAGHGGKLVAVKADTTGLEFRPKATVAETGQWADLLGKPSTFAPIAHASSHQDGGADEINVAGLSGLLADAQNPVAHATRHKSGGTDPIRLDELAATTDNTSLNASTISHGLLRKLSGNPNHFLDGTGVWRVPPSGGPGAALFVDLGDVPSSYTGANGKNVHVSRDGTGLVFGDPSLPSLDLGKLFPGVAGKTYANMDVQKDIVGDECFGFPGGMSIGDFQTVFPNFYHVLHTDLGWSDAEILGLTYFACAWNELGFMTYESGAGFPFHRYSLHVPAGKHWYNCELRWGQAIIQCAGSFHYFGFGNTELALTKTNWKSLYGDQNDGVYMGIVPWTYAGEDGEAVYPIALGGGYEYCHSMLLRDCCMSGTGGDFNDHTYREVLFNYWTPGENSGVENCLFTDSNDFGLLITGACAYADIRDCSFFRNKVAGWGIRGVARATISGSFSGDFNPWAIYTFRQGETLTSPNKLTAKTTTTSGFTQPNVAATTTVNVVSTAGLKVNYPVYIEGGGHYTVTNIAGLTITIRNTGNNGNAAPAASITTGKTAYLPYWPCFQNGNPGGNIEIRPYKQESFCCYGGFDSYSSCTPDQPGKGQMLFRGTGRFHFAVHAGAATAHLGRVDCLVQIIDDYDIGTGGIPLSNSSVDLRNIGTVCFAHWLHDVKRNVKWVANVNDDDSHGTGIMWTDNYNSGQGYDPLRVGFTMTTTSASYGGILPFRNNADDHAWDHNNPPTWGYDRVTGAPH